MSQRTFISFIFILLAGCASTSGLQKMSPARLCFESMAGNVFNRERAYEAVLERDVDCRNHESEIKIIAEYEAARKAVLIESMEDHEGSFETEMPAYDPSLGRSKTKCVSQRNGVGQVVTECESTDGY